MTPELFYRWSTFLFLVFLTHGAFLLFTFKHGSIFVLYIRRKVGFLFMIVVLLLLCALVFLLVQIDYILVSYSV